MYLLSSAAAGLVFGLGLLLSGMANPAKVLGFLDLAGRWDPSLALVMAGAVAVAFFAFRVAARRDNSLLGGAMRLPPVQGPSARGIDRRLVFGSLLFGVGWGLAGFCPGPALVALVGWGTAHLKAGVFVAAMLVGMALFHAIEALRRRED
ncbi:MAG: hypothetical protein JWP29_1829 [Rhodoferax sp.]|nr:hypothetical protein [Rhodoferax sp.]